MLKSEKTHSLVRLPLDKANEMLNMGHKAAHIIGVGKISNIRHIFTK